MSGDLYNPLTMAELEGTSWRRRFTGAEYSIFLDHFPDRKIIRDSLLTAEEAADTSKTAAYESAIEDLFLTDSRMSSMSPAAVLHCLRSLRAGIFGDFSNRKLYKAGGSGKKPLCSLYAEAAEPCKSELAAALKNADSVLFFPSEFEPPEQQLEFLTGLTGSGIRPAGAGGFRLPLAGGDIKRLKDLQAEGCFILTADLWAYLEFFRNLGNFGLILDDSEWFAHGLLQSACLPGARPVSVAAVQPQPFPRDVDISGVQYCSLSLPEFLAGSDRKRLLQRLNGNARDLKLGGSGALVGSEFYDRENSWSRADEGVLITTAVFDEADVDCFPVFHSECSRPAAPGGEDFRGVLTSFNYYFTDNLAELYNRSVPAGQRIPFGNFFIDYLRYRRAGGWYETLPLYNKAFTGCSRDGRVFAGHYGISSVEISLGDNRLLFSRNHINPAGSGSSEGLYLPGCAFESVGSGKFCIVIVQDRIICSGAGPFLVPPVGAVIVLKDSPGEIPVSVGVKTRFDGLPFDMEDIRWLVGGFNLLIKDGRNLYPNTAVGIRSLRSEGWMLEQSARTQETQLTAGIRQPRLVFGRTVSGRLFAVQFAGRTNMSDGASFSECADFVLTEIASDDEIDFCINFDGGASAAIIGVGADGVRPLSFSAPSASNPAGVPRPLPAYFSIKTI